MPSASAGWSQICFSRLSTREDVDVGERLGLGADAIGERRCRAVGDGLAVELALLVRERAGAGVLDLLRQLVEDGLLEAAQDERRDQAPQRLELLVADRLLAGAEAVEVVLVVAEVAGQHEVEQVLELVRASSRSACR